MPREKHSSKFYGEGEGFAGFGSISPHVALSLHKKLSRYKDRSMGDHKMKSVLEGLAAEYNQPLSLDAILEGDRGADYEWNARWTRQDLLVDRQQEEMLERVESNEVIHSLLQELARRDYRLFEVVMFRYGFWDGVPWTLEETGEQLAGPDGKRITRERVRQLQDKALAELGNIVMARAVEYEIKNHQLPYRRKFRPPEPKPIRAPAHLRTIGPFSQLDLRSYMPLPLLAETLGFSYMTLRNWSKEPAFPQGRLVTATRRAYLLSEVVIWAAESKNIGVETG